jgi:penicillin-binding protein 1A
MREDGYITIEQETAAIATPIVTRRREEAELVSAPYFAEEVRRELLARYGEKGLYQAGLSVRTSLDPALQAIADRSLRTGLIAYDRRHGWRGPVAHMAAPVQEWSQKLAAIAQPAGAGEWRLAVVLATDGEGASIGLPSDARGRIPFAELRWARPELPDQHVGAIPKVAADVVKPGDVVLVEALGGDAKQPLYALRQIPEVSGAIISMDPHTGRVLAMAGGYSYEMSQFNRATQAKRQPGSAFKPFVYLTALENGFTPSTLILDAPFVADQGPGLPKWKPTNYNTTSFNGPTPLRVGVEQSKNMMTARLGAVVGLDKVAHTVETFGILDRMPLQYAMLLGAGETTPLRLATAYAMLVNGGKRVTPSFIDRVQDRDGKTIARADTRSCEGCNEVDWHGQAPPVLPDTRDTVVDAASAYQIVSILQGVVERGTGRVIASVGKPLAGKTGTTNDYQDNWFMGFSPDLAAGVYVGFDNPHSLGEKEEGAHNAAPVFRDFMAAALKNTPATAFRIPPGIRLVRVNAATGQLARPGDRTVIYEAFKPGTEPNGDSVVVNGYGVSPDGSTPAPIAGTSPSPASYSIPATGTGGLY